jgi:hypothetical protein
MPLAFGSLSGLVPKITGPFTGLTSIKPIGADAGVKFGVALSGFFDRNAVLSKLTPAEAVALSKFGAFVRQRAMTSIRKSGKKGKPSSPGSPPRSHDKITPGGGRAKHLLRTLMFFSYDASSNSVVIGPAVINRPTNAPALCEFGGKAIRPMRGRRGRFVFVRYPARPYMNPALERERPKFPQLFGGMLNGRGGVNGG